MELNKNFEIEYKQKLCDYNTEVERFHSDNQYMSDQITQNIKK